MDSIEDLHTAEQTQNTAEAHEKKEKKGFSFDKLRYKNMNIRARLLAGFSTILLFVLALGITNYIALSIIEDEMYIVNDRELALMKNYDNVNLAQANKLSAARAYMVTENDDYLEVIEDYSTYQHREIERILHHENSQEVTDVFAELFALDDYMQTEVIEYYDNGYRNEALTNMTQVFDPRAEALSADLQNRGEAQGLNAREHIYTVQDQIDSTQIFMLILMVIAVLVAISSSFWFANSFRRPMVNVMRKLHAFGEGQLNIEPFEIDGNTEIDQLLAATNQVQKDLTRIIGNLRQATEELSQQSEELSQSSNEVRSGSEQVAITMQELSSGTESQAHAASDLANNMEDFALEFENVSKSSEEISTASEGVLMLSGQGVELMNSSSEQMTKINEIVTDVVSKMTQLEEDTQEITKLIEIIHGIADQTNLLALNAAIEAARAGEHGRGFSIVADEVRKLSEQVAESVEEITGFVENIQTDSKAVTSSLSEGETEAVAGLESINKTSVTFNQIFDAVDKVVNNIFQMNATLGTLSETNEEMSTSVTEVASVSEESAAGVEETSAASQEINSTMDEVASNAAHLAELSEILSGEVAEYTLLDESGNYIDFDLI